MSSDEDDLYAATPGHASQEDAQSAYASSYLDELSSDERDGDALVVPAANTIVATSDAGSQQQQQPAIPDSHEHQSHQSQAVTAAPISLELLPTQVLRRLFRTLPTKDLINCLHTSRALRHCLTAESTPEEHSDFTLLTSNDVWRQSREFFAPGLPAPLSGFTELQMLDMLLGRSCQECSTGPTLTPISVSPWNSGPGREGSLVGVRCIWHYGRRLCANCLESQSIKDVELIVSPDKTLLPGLPYIFRTADMHYVSPSLVQARNSSVPPNVQLSKVFPRAALDKLRALQASMRSPHLPPGTAEAWHRDLHSTSERKLKDAARWVAWEQSRPQGLSVKQWALLAYSASHGMPAPITHDHSLVPQHIPAQAYAALPPFFGQSYQNPQRGPVYGYPGQEYNNGTLNSVPQPGAPLNGNGTAGPTSSAAAKQLMNERKAEIQRRCLEEFVPSLLPNVLEHIEAYKAAIKISRPLTEEDWRYLKPRFQEGRLKAEQAELTRARNFDSTLYVNALTQRTVRRNAGATGAAEQKCEKAQRPVRTRLQAIASQVIEERWLGASRLIRADCANFAADVIVTTIARFRETEDTSKYEMGDTITLETVKNLYDHRIKAVMERMDCKEMYMCSQCDDASKWYTFDGMMQHFGAKHDSDFGVGNIVIAWQTAEWPEEPPFKAHPVRNRRVPPAYAEVAQIKKMEQEERLEITDTGARNEPVVSEIPSFMASLRQPSYSVANPAPARPLVINEESDMSEYEPEPVAKQYRNQSLPTTSHEPTPEAGFRDAASSQPRHVSSNPALRAFQAPVQSVSVEIRQDLAKTCLELMKKTAGLGLLDDVVRLQVIFWHASQHYASKHGDALTVEVLRDTFSSRSELKQLKKWSGLRCKLCADAAEFAAEHAAPDMLTSSEARYHSAALLEHVRLKHGPSTPTTNIIHLPDIFPLRNIPYLSGITDEKLRLIASALPAEVFPNGVPSAQPPPAVSVPATGDASYDSDEPADPVINTPPAPREHKKKRKRDALLAHRPQFSVDDTDLSMPEAGDDEYDPRRPRLSGSEVPAQHAPRQPKAGRPQRDFFNYETSYIPDVIRSRPTDRASSTPQPAAPAHPTVQQHPPAQQATASNAASPPAYYDQYGNPLYMQAAQSTAPVSSIGGLSPEVYAQLLQTPQGQAQLRALAQAQPALAAQGWPLQQQQQQAVPYNLLGALAAQPQFQQQHFQQQQYQFAPAPAAYQHNPAMFYQAAPGYSQQAPPAAPGQQMQYGNPGPGAAQIEWDSDKE